MTYLRAFIAGLALPSVLIPIFLYAAYYLGKPQLLNVPALHLLPIVWGLWNVLYFAIDKRNLPANQNTRLWVTGALLGVLVALIGVFYLHLPTLIGLPNNLYYLPLVLVPVIYAVLWRYVVKELNSLLGLWE